MNVGYTAARFSDANLGTFITGAPSGFSTPAIHNQRLVPRRRRRNITGVELVLAHRIPLRLLQQHGDCRSAPAFVAINFKPTVQTVTSQIVYKFTGGMPAPVYPATPTMATNWTGLYANAGIGYGVWNADTTQGIVGAGVCLICATQVVGGKGYLGVVGAGYDWQFAPSWVAGLFGDFDISSLKGTIQDQVFGNSGTIKQTSAWAVGPRLGWLPSPQTMIYANGGYTGARFSGADMVSMTNGAPWDSRRRPSPPTAGSSVVAWKRRSIFSAKAGSGVMSIAMRVTATRPPRIGLEACQSLTSPLSRRSRPLRPRSSSSSTERGISRLQTRSLKAPGITPGFYFGVAANR